MGWKTNCPLQSGEGDGEREPGNGLEDTFPILEFGPEVSIITCIVSVCVFVHCKVGNFACQQMPAKKDSPIRTIPSLWWPGT